MCPAPTGPCRLRTAGRSSPCGCCWTPCAVGWTTGMKVCRRRGKPLRGRRNCSSPYATSATGIAPFSVQGFPVSGDEQQGGGKLLNAPRPDVALFAIIQANAAASCAGQLLASIHAIDKGQKCQEACKWMTFFEWAWVLRLRKYFFVLEKCALQGV